MADKQLAKREEKPEPFGRCMGQFELYVGKLAKIPKQVKDLVRRKRGELWEALRYYRWLVERYHNRLLDSLKAKGMSIDEWADRLFMPVDLLGERRDRVVQMAREVSKKQFMATNSNEYAAMHVLRDAQRAAKGGTPKPRLAPVTLVPPKKPGADLTAQQWGELWMRYAEGQEGTIRELREEVRELKGHVRGLIAEVRTAVAKRSRQLQHYPAGRAASNAGSDRGQA